MENIKKLKSILTGWKNFISKSEVTEMVARVRAEECNKCEDKEHTILTAFVNENLKEVKGYKCNLCGCPLSPKIRSLNEKCPKQLW